MQHILYYDMKIALIFCKKDFVDIELAEENSKFLSHGVTEEIKDLMQRQKFVVNQKEGVHCHCHKGRDSRMVNSNNNNELEPFMTTEGITQDDRLGGIML